MNDYSEKYTAAHEQVLEKTCELSKKIIIEAYTSMIKFLKDYGECNQTILDTADRVLVASLWNVFVAELQEKSNDTIRDIANEAARQYGVGKLDPNKVIS